MHFNHTYANLIELSIKNKNMQNTEEHTNSSQEAQPVFNFANTDTVGDRSIEWSSYVKISPRLIVGLVVGWVLVMVLTNIVVSNTIGKPKISQSKKLPASDLRVNLARDEERKANINSLSVMLEKHYEKLGLYPSPEQINSPETRKSDPSLKVINRRTFMDPAGSSSLLAKQPKKGTYYYQPSPANCNNMKILCKGYEIGATLDNGSLYTKKNVR